MRALAILLALLGLASVAACDEKNKEDAPVSVPGGGPKGAPQADPAAAVPGEAAPDETVRAEEAAAAQCTDWCTLVAGCWAKLNEGEHSAGGECESACARRSAEERRAFGECVMARTADCKAMLDC